MVIDYNPAMHLAAIDEWLEHAFDIKSTDTPLLAFQPRTPVEAAVAGMVARVMSLGAVLLRAIRIPVFDIGRINSLQPKMPDATQWQLDVALPRVDYTSGDAFTRAYQMAAKTIQWLAGQSRTAANLERLFSMLQDEFVRHFNVAAHGGESSISVLHETWKKRIPFRHLGSGIYQLGSGARQLRVNSGAIHVDSAIGARISQDKWRSANLLRDAGLPAPVHTRAATQDHALAAAHQLGWPVVVKPLDRDRGEGVAVNITSTQQLAVAFSKAAALSKTVLVERQVPGICHRVLVVNGKVRIVAKRMPKSVKGDGRLSIRELVERANAEENARPPWSRLKPFPLDELALACLASANLTPDSIPAEGVMIPLRPIQTSEWGGVVENLIDQIHPENAAAAIKAARLFNLTVAGIDIISTDISRPWHETNAIINEVNFSPLLAGRTTAGVIATLLDEWLPTGGRIPIAAVVGGESALAEGLRIQADFAARGFRCWLATHDDIVSDQGGSVHVPAPGLYPRCMALLPDPHVEALVMVIQTDELLRTGLPANHIDQIIVIPDSAGSSRKANVSKRVQPAWMREMDALLRAYTPAS